MAGNVEKFTEYLQHILLQTISIHDTAKQPEAFFHGLMLGLTASLSRDKYEIKSNRESGVGRYDIAIIPKDTIKPAIILELKSVVLPKRKFTEFYTVGLQRKDCKNWFGVLR